MWKNFHKIKKKLKYKTMFTIQYDLYTIYIRFILYTIYDLQYDLYDFLDKICCTIACKEYASLRSHCAHLLA